MILEWMLDIAVPVISLRFSSGKREFHRAITENDQSVPGTVVFSEFCLGELLADSLGQEAATLALKT